jgi:DNA-binding NtrC family response regulator
VLVVDHEPLIRWSLAETLTEAGHTVVLAADRMAAFEAVAAGPPFDVVLLDGDLPGSCDLSLLSGLKALAPSARVILMTAFGSRALERSALSHGASLVLGKPFDMEDLPALVA